MRHLAALLGLLWASEALSQSNCAPREVVVGRLDADYGEAFSGGGLQSAKRAFEIWFSVEKGTWTILMTRSDGISCIMASGTNWQRVELMSDEEG